MNDYFSKSGFHLDATLQIKLLNFSRYYYLNFKAV